MIHPQSLCTSGESKTESPLLTRSHQISRWLFLYKKKEDFSPYREKSARTNTYNTTEPNPTEPTHKI